ncbi:MAG: sigma-54-dependent Fis family transcriptional regulator [Bacteroidia bacterium]|nr:sigma-54-dependent Fis family transcriptional regulator [Bacteroidia bacterium]
MELQAIKARFGIIGNSPLLEHAIDTARQVAPTEITVLITGQSGVGKEVFPQIIHQLSSRKHGPYIAVNCGAIPEGTIDSELFGHEKGSFTGAHEARKGYFETANSGTIFLDEVAELPLGTQVRLLRVLETGEFLKVGSSKVQKTNVRVVAATNINMPQAIANGKFREDLFYRLNTVPISIPSLQQRKDDIPLLFRKFASDFAEKYRMSTKQLDADAMQMLIAYPFPGNIRQLRNLCEQICILEKNPVVTTQILTHYLPQVNTNTLPVLLRDENKNSHADFANERDLLYKVLFEMKKDINDLKRVVYDNMPVSDNFENIPSPHNAIIDMQGIMPTGSVTLQTHPQQMAEEVEESLSISEKEKELIVKALQKHRNRRNNAAKELGISERTLYRKINEYGLK